MSDMTIVIAAVVAAVTLALLVWAGVAYSALFQHLERERWRGWIPLVREMEIFRIAGMPTYYVGLLLIPPVTVYALVMLAIAYARVGGKWRWGNGNVAWGLILPPLWATLALRIARSAREVREKPLAQFQAAPAARQPQTEDTQSAPFELIVHGGFRVPLTNEMVILGRDPRTSARGVQVVKIDDPTRTMSKSHAKLTFVGTLWFVQDLGSTRGTIATAPGGEVRAVEGNEAVPVLGELHLGDVRVMIRRTLAPVKAA